MSVLVDFPIVMFHFFSSFHIMSSGAPRHKCVLCDAELDTKAELQEHFR